MKKELFLGVDFSKATIDVTFFTSKNVQQTNHKQFDNSKEGFQGMYTWVKQQEKTKAKNWLICGEHTGLYSVQFSMWAIKKKLYLWLENPTQIKRSTGIKREKSDKTDSKDIALYAYRFADKAKQYEPMSDTITQLADLMHLRERLLKQKLALETPCKELKRVQSHQSIPYIDQVSTQVIDFLIQQMAKIDKKMDDLVKQDDRLATTYNLSTSVKGIGPRITLALLVYTHGFQSFNNVRQLACYCGVAPFANSSGTSLRGRTKVNHLANKQLKSLLHQGARSAVQHDQKLKAYYQRKINEGKAHNLVINNVKNKLLHTLWAVINSGKCYEPNYSRGAA